MPRPLYDSPYIFGIHEPGGEQEMVNVNRPGWIIFTEEVGHDPNNRSGKDFTPWSNQDLGILCRINNGYEPNGTIPHSSLYRNFAIRCANYVRASQGCKIWIIGNEMNFAVERPGVQIDWSRATFGDGSRGPDEDEQARPTIGRDLPERFSALLPDSRNTRRLIVNPGETITPQMYAQCYRLCRDAIHAVPGHENDQVLIGAVAPWNIDTMYPGNPGGDWITYFQDLLRTLGPDNCDGITLHTYADGTDLNLIYDDFLMGNPSFSHRRYQFRAYQDFMDAVPPNMRHLPVYITETNQNRAWLNQNIGWVQRAYGEIDHWNQQPGHQQIRALILYRWPNIDRWYIEGKQGVVGDFRQALTMDYRWQEQPASALPAARNNYQTEWIQVLVPSNMQPGEVVTISVTVKNTGGLTWMRGSTNPVRLGYHFHDGDRRLILPVERDLRTYLPRDVAPGATVTFDASVATPSQPGAFTLELDMVHEGVTWFADQNADTYRTPIQLGSTATAPSADGPLEIQIIDIQDQMPTGPLPFQPRDLGQVRNLVINHTAVRPDIDIAIIANVHVQRGYPGIAYDYVVDDRGRIFQVSPLDAVVRADQEWSGQGVNICLTGNFTDAPPPTAQLNAAGLLCAWLAENLGLPASSIVGAGTLLSTASPGNTFYEGPTWRNTLVQMVDQHLQEIPASSPAPTPQPIPAPIPIPDSGATAEQIAQLQTQISQLLAQIDELESENEQLQQLIDQGSSSSTDSGGDTMIAQPIVENVIHDLPRDSSGFSTRKMEDIRYIVVNHTAVPADVPVDRIAQAHRNARPPLPGILYQFYIEADGTTYQTQPLLEVVDVSHPYIQNGINIAFAGNFTDAIPAPAQLAAGAQLIAWLMEQFPQIKLDDVRGVREFIPHSSPGDQWMEGQNWKALLRTAIQSAETVVSTPPGSADPQVAALLAQVTHLQQQVSTLQSQLQSSQQQVTNLQGQLQNAGSAAMELATLQQQMETLEEEYDALSQQSQTLQNRNLTLQNQVRDLNAEIQQLLQAQPSLDAAPAPSGPPLVTQPAINNKVNQLPRHPTLRYDRRSRNQITHIAIHHTAIRPDVGPERVAELHIMEDLSRGKQAWPGIGYHFFIHDDGTIDQCNDLETVSYQVYQNNAHSLGIVLAGSFMNGVAPTDAQLNSAARLTAWLMQELTIPLSNVWGHREFPNNATVCPGSEWTEGKRWRTELFSRVQQVQSGQAIKSMQHILLFWERGFPGPFAEADLLNAMNYIRRFRPNLGFTVEDAMQAEYVTIVGGDAGVSGHDEQRLRDAGCVVERISGRDEAHTAQLLADKVHSNRRHSQMDPE